MLCWMNGGARISKIEMKEGSVAVRKMKSPASQDRECRNMYVVEEYISVNTCLRWRTREKKERQSYSGRGEKEREKEESSGKKKRGEEARKSKSEREREKEEGKGREGNIGERP